MIIAYSLPFYTNTESSLYLPFFTTQAVFATLKLDTHILSADFIIISSALCQYQKNDQQIYKIVVPLTLET